jgi:hypothetical protein
VVGRLLTALNVLMAQSGETNECLSMPRVCAASICGNLQNIYLVVRSADFGNRGRLHQNG